MNLVKIRCEKIHLWNGDEKFMIGKNNRNVIEIPEKDQKNTNTHDEWKNMLSAAIIKQWV